MFATCRQPHSCINCLVRQRHQRSREQPSTLKQNHTFLTNSNLLQQVSGKTDLSLSASGFPMSWTYSLTLLSGV